jgi:hypothetical protein
MMQENPYRSPLPAREPLRNEPSLRQRAGDVALVGLIYGGTIGAGSAAAAAVCFSGWLAVASVFGAGEEPPDFWTAERLIAVAVARVTLAGLAGAACGASFGLLLGLLAVCGPPLVRQRLTLLACFAAATATALAIGLLWPARGRAMAGFHTISWAALAIIAVSAAASGGALLARRLSVHVARDQR